MERGLEVIFFSRIKIYLLAAGAFLLGLAGIYVAGRKAGKDATQVSEQRRRIEDYSTAQEIENEVEALSVDELRKRSTQWVRGE